MGARFTAAQWKELETQAMIYKYMVASLPVPYQLLLPIIQNQNHFLPLIRSSKEVDVVEVGRCKRTDGKKWRCSRDVAPNQKYCERHMHRGRPRSRKHVEQQQLSKNKNNPKVIVGSSSTTILPSSSAPLPFPFPFFLHHHHNMQSNKRGCDWSREEGSDQQWRLSTLNNDYGRRDSSSSGMDLLSMGMGLGNRSEVLNPLAEVLLGVSPSPIPTHTGEDGVISSSQRRLTLVKDTTTTTLPSQCFT